MNFILPRRSAQRVQWQLNTGYWCYACICCSRERVTERQTQRQREWVGGGGANKETETQKERHRDRKGDREREGETERDRDRASNLLVTTAAVLSVLAAGNARQNTAGQYVHLSTSTRTFMPSILILRLWTTVTFLKYVRYCHLVTDYSV